MPRTRRLARGQEITYSTAKEQEVNILHQLTYYDQQHQFFALLSDKREWMKTVVARHLGLQSAAHCRVADTDEWLHGSFNVCIPIVVGEWAGKRVLIRFPLPYRVGEAFHPGNGDEKLRCEAATYAWLQDHCPGVSIPQLYGFTLSTGETFTRLENLPFFPRCYNALRRRLLSWLGYSVPSNYVRCRPINHPDPVSDTGYLVVEYIDETQGAMLSNTWADGRHNPHLCKNLFRGLSRVLLNMARVPLPKIGSFIIDNDGFLSLSNRPLSVEIHQLENENIPTGIPRHYTYSTTESYIVDMLSVHDSRFRNQPNAINDLGDMGCQLAALSAMRTVFPSFFPREDRRGPFSLMLTDLHQSNIFVDDKWNVTHLVDLEWACSRPTELLQLPYWLTNKGVDQLDSAEYNDIREEFMTIFADEEEKLDLATPKIATIPRLSEMMEQTWATGTFWYALALSSPSGLFTIFNEHIRPLFCEKYGEEFNLILPFLWDKKIGQIAGRKIADKEKYDEKLRQAFEDDS
ncbi:hypothetical protein BO71DRAFT_398968 [Aspergillus ellipticus CBS 707.79]|uniref:Aminoglycoside phosphotransferase domain-containing protein n=1 Tax=Aspergillus ellipticus CBS 707.79 TaxID=1448320 RepID=A0A319DAY3_9EURO|nr:hypothetical protein BO71DRAFT_398968 [Aspergillus ellipticus CBS 707.79]